MGEGLKKKRTSVILFRGLCACSTWPGKSGAVEFAAVAFMQLTDCGSPSYLNVRTWLSDGKR